MSLPVDLLVRGTPVSFRSNRQVVCEWRRKIATAARARVRQLAVDEDISISITHFYKGSPRCDADNICKPICDALTNIVYRDDRQLAECTCRRVSVGRSFRVFGMPKALAVALSEGAEFVFIRIKQIGDPIPSLMRFHVSSSPEWTLP